MNRECVMERYLEHDGFMLRGLTGISQLRSGGKWRGRPGFQDVRPAWESGPLRMSGPELGKVRERATGRVLLHCLSER